jgi:hypothetical protein
MPPWKKIPGSLFRGVFLGIALLIRLLGWFQGRKHNPVIIYKLLFDACT